MTNPSSYVLHHHLGSKYPLVTHAEGLYLFDHHGRRYLDAAGAVGVVNLGYGIPEIAEAIANQAMTLAFAYGGSVTNKPQEDLARKLQTWAPSGMGEIRTLFSSGGAEANEAALKLAYQYHYERGNPMKRKVVGRWQSYHGNTIGTLSMSGRTRWRAVHGVYLLDFPHIAPPYCYRCPWQREYPGCNLMCAYELERVIRQEGPENISAFIAEPVIGTSMSAVVPPSEYYPVVREICDAHDVLLIADEVMSGVGRTGEKWGIEHWQITPDIIATSKGISGGYSPLGATILRERVWRAIENGSKLVMHSSTYGGNPISCAAGVAVLRYIEEHDLVTRAGDMGAILSKMLHERLEDLPCVAEIRGKGLFIGIELVQDKKTKQPYPVEVGFMDRVARRAFDNGLLILPGVTGLVDGIAGDHFEVLPAYTITEDEVDTIVSTIRKSIIEVLEELAGT